MAIAFRCATTRCTLGPSRRASPPLGHLRLFPGKRNAHLPGPRAPTLSSTSQLVPYLLIESFVMVVGLDETAATPIHVNSSPESYSCCCGFAHAESQKGQMCPSLRRILMLYPQKITHPDLLKAFIIATTSMLSLPLEASAEMCQPAHSFANMPLFISVALIGAAVGGLLARQRKDELKRLNNQLRQINAVLRRQAQIESFAPGLTYAPVGRATETEVIVDPKKQQLMTNLRTGKNFLRNQDLDKEVMEFRAALDLAESMEDHVEEKKAARGLGASLQRLGKYREAVKYYSKVLELSKLTGEDSGCTEAYGAIADCYAELGYLERAAKLYDKYISRLRSSD